MTQLPPPPVWAQPQLPPPWLDWFTRVAAMFTNNAGVLSGVGGNISLANFTVTAQSPNIKLSFTNSNEANTAYVQVFRGPDTDPANAVLINTVVGGVNTYIDSVGAGVTRYYWIRAISKGGEAETAVGPQAATTLSWAEFSGGINAVGALPSSGMAEGDVVYLTTDKKIYRYDGSSWITWVDGSDLVNSSVTAGKISVSSLAAITTTTGTLVVDTAGYIRGGQTDYNTGVGWFLGYSGSAYKLSIGNPSGNYLAWDGSQLILNGYLNDVTPYAAGDVVFAVQNISNNTASSSYVKLYEYILGRGGTIRCKATVLKSGGGTAYFQIYRNGVAVGTEKSTSSSSNVELSMDVSGWTAGDKVQFYFKTSGVGTTYASVPTLACDTNRFAGVWLL